MKGLKRVVIGSAVGGLLGAAAFFAVESWIPITGDADAWEQKPVPLAISEGDSSNAAGVLQRSACLSGSLFEREGFEQSVCKQFRKLSIASQVSMASQRCPCLDDECLNSEDDLVFQ